MITSKNDQFYGQTERSQLMNWSNQQLIAVNKVLPRYLLNFWRHKSATAVEDNFMGRLFNEKY